MRFSHAICRRPASSIADGLTTADEGAPSFERTIAQLDAYMATLRALGVEVDLLEALDAFPDAHFVEDVAVITPEVTVLTRPGHPSRRGEVDAIAETLAAHRPITRLEAPATLDGGDVLRIGSTWYVGRSERTNAAGFEAFAAIVRAQGMDCVAIPVAAGLHLKSSVNALDDETVVLTRAFVDCKSFERYRHVVLPEAEDYAACALRVNGGVILPAGYPAARDAIAGLGFAVHEIDTSEFRKMDGGLTCLSLRWSPA